METTRGGDSLLRACLGTVTRPVRRASPLSALPLWVLLCLLIVGCRESETVGGARVAAIDDLVTFGGRGRGDGAQSRRLGLSSRERQALVAFLRTLTDVEFTRDPRFSDPFR